MFVIPFILLNDAPFRITLSTGLNDPELFSLPLLIPRLLRELLLLRLDKLPKLNDGWVCEEKFCGSGICVRGLLLLLEWLWFEVF